MNMRKMTIAGVAVAAMALGCLPATSQQAANHEPMPTTNATPTEQPKGKSFLKPMDAAAALYAAARRDDDAMLLAILGSNGKEIVEWNEDANERHEQRVMFAQKYEQMHRLVREPDNTVALYVGAENWPLPIPLVKYKDAWYFDSDLGRQEIQYRRIGRNEMEAIEVCHTLVDAEKEYQSIAHQYTAKFVSGNGSHDGLYWKTADDKTRSPIGPYLAQAGVSESEKGKPEAFYGYYYRILLQGSDGFAIVAFPAEYRSSGVMTFMVKPDGTAYEKDLGDKTPALAKQVASSNSDDSWKKVD
jgi:hypothetical protein